MIRQERAFRRLPAAARGKKSVGLSFREKRRGSPAVESGMERGSQKDGILPDGRCRPEKSAADVHPMRNCARGDLFRMLWGGTPAAEGCFIVSSIEHSAIGKMGWSYYFPNIL